jgi:hypothetical protein
MPGNAARTVGGMKVERAGRLAERREQGTQRGLQGLLGRRMGQWRKGEAERTASACKVRKVARNPWRHMGPKG